MSSSSESCQPKGAPTTPQTKQDHLDTRIETISLSLEEFELPGLGEPGEICGKDRLPESNAVCPNGDAVRYEPHLCRKVECPTCYEREDRERAFELAVQIEGVAELMGERPHALVWSIPPREGSRYSIEDINTKLMRRGRRRSKRKSEVLGGVSVVHPARIQDRMKVELRAVGYGANGPEGGLWEGVRDDVFNLGDWREYAEYSPHGHSIGFPELIEPHEGSEFLVRKYTTLEDTESVVAHIRYLMSHRGVWRGDGQFTSIRRWGMFHHASKEYVDVEEELGEVEYRALCGRVADVMGGEWSESDGLHYPDEEGARCPECGTHKREFVDLWDLPRLASGSWQGGGDWLNRLSESQREFFEELVEILHHEAQPIIKRGDVVHPDDVAVWVDGDRPPPGE